MNTHDHTLARSNPQGRASEDTIRDLPHDPYLKPMSPALCSLSASIFEEIETANPQPKRRRKDATERKRTVVGNILANLTTFHETGNLRGSIILNMYNRVRSRYDRREVSPAMVRQMVSAMEGLGWLDRKAGEYRKTRTTIRPSLKLWTVMRALGAGPHVGRAPGAETVILKAVVSKGGDKVLVDYADTFETERLRAEVEEINACLSGADLRLAGRPIASSFLTRRFQIEGRGAPRTFDRVGRLFGGWWMNLPKRERPQVTLGGEPLVDLDFKAMFANLAYWRCGLPFPEDDPYARIDGLTRNETKKAMLAMFFRVGRMRRLPRDLSETGVGDRWTAPELDTVIRSRHAPIASQFGCMAGMEIMKLESDILVSALLNLAKQGVPALAMHDGLMVAKSRKRQAWTAMEEASQKLLGVVLPIAEKPLLEAA